MKLKSDITSSVYKDKFYAAAVVTVAVASVPLELVLLLEEKTPDFREGGEGGGDTTEMVEC